jgi:O-antigen ligase
MERLYALQLRHLWQAFSREKASFWLLCFYIFLEYVRPQTIYPVIDVIPWAQTAILLTIALFLIEGNRISVRNSASTVLFLFLMTILLSSIFAYSPSESVDKIDIFLVWFVVYFLVINIVNTESRLFVFLCLYLLWNFKMTQHGFLSWAGRGFSYANWGVTGAPGWFQNSGEFGIQLSIIIPLSLYFVWALRKYWGKLKLLLVLSLPATAIASILATNSRGALLGAAAAILWMAIQSKKKLVFAVVMVIPLAFVVYKSLPQESATRFQTVGMDRTSQARLERWKDGMEIIAAHPVLGIGYANWLDYYRTNYRARSYRPLGEGLGLSHNIFIDAGAELGYVGLMLFLLMIISTFVNNRRTRKAALAIDNKFLYYMAHAFDASMIGFLVSASFVSVLFYPYFWIALAFTVALNNVATKALRERDEVPAWDRVRTDGDGTLPAPPSHTTVPAWPRYGRDADIQR